MNSTISDIGQLDGNCSYSDSEDITPTNEGSTIPVHISQRIPKTDQNVNRRSFRNFPKKK